MMVDERDEDTEHDLGGDGAFKRRRSAKQVVETVTEFAAPIAAAAGAWLDRVEFKEAGRRSLLQVYIDKSGGVTIDDCADVSRQLSAVLDVHEVLRTGYTLEVSSPGLTRPLREARDYERYAGRLAVLHLREAVEGRRQVLGELAGLDGDRVVIKERGTDVVVRIPLGAVAKARLEIEI